MSGICDTCRRNPCRIRMDGLKVCDLYKGGETRWRQLFGTPERAARTLKAIPCGSRPCSDCPVSEPCFEEKTNPKATLEWLEGDA